MHAALRYLARISLVSRSYLAPLRLQDAAPEAVQRASSTPWADSLVLDRADLHNAEEMMDAMRGLNFRDDEIIIVIRCG